MLHNVQALTRNLSSFIMEISRVAVPKVKLPYNVLYYTPRVPDESQFYLLKQSSHAN